MHSLTPNVTQPFVYKFLVMEASIEYVRTEEKGRGSQIGNLADNGQILKLQKKGDGDSKILLFFSHCIVDVI